MSAFALRNISKSYGTNSILNDVSIEAEDGEFIALVGPSGCGKSTLLRIAAGLDHGDAGSIWMGDREITAEHPADRNVAMVFQSYALYPHMTVRENMGFSLKIGKVQQAEIDQRVNEAAAILDLEKYMDRRPSQLSGGQRQRVAMGRAIVRKPEVFLFDEPLSNLDAKLRTQVRTEIKRLHAKVQATMIYVTHDQVEAMTLSDRIVIMRDGYIEQVGTPEEVFKRPATRFVAGFIGSPPMNLNEATVDGGRLVLKGGQSLPLPLEFRNKVVAGEKVIFGLRPDDIYPTGHGLSSGEATDVHELSLPVSITEPLGNETLVFITLGEKEWVSRMLNPRPLAAGETIKLSFDLSQAHLFSAETGKTLRS